MVLPALILATGVALPLHTAGPLADGHWATAMAGTHRRHLSAGPQGHHGGHPAESGRPRVRAPHARRPAATQTSLRQAAQSDWVLMVRPQHRRPGPHVAPAQDALLEPGFLAHRDSAAAPVGPWLRIFDGQGKSWVNVTNVRAAQAPAGWDRLVVQIHPALRHVRTVSHLPLPPSLAPRAAAVLPAAPVATPAPAPQPAVPPQVVQVVQVVQPAPVVVQPAGSIPDRIVAAGDAAWGPGQGQALLWIVERESSANPYAVNTSSYACGLFQRLPCDVQLGDVQGQIADGVAYVTARYGTASNAMGFWQAHNWY